jgi:MacB-like periplasmic core domain
MRSEYVSGNYFATLGVSSYAGRLLNENDDTPGAAPTLVLSYRTWQTEFAADPAVVGSTVYVQTNPFVVAGIAPPGFFGDRIITNPLDFWMPLASEPVLEGDNSALKGIDELWLYPMGRVRPGINTGALQAKLSVVLRQWLATRPTYSDHGGTALIPRQHVILAPQQHLQRRHLQLRDCAHDHEHALHPQVAHHCRHRICICNRGQHNLRAAQLLQFGRRVLRLVVDIRSCQSDLGPLPD